MANYKKSPIDNLFYNLMGYYPTKEGTAYEIISAAVLSFIENKEAVHNQFLTGESESQYQLDGLIDGEIMIEAKDYTKRKEKVGRDDLQKMQGALTDLPQIKKGYFTSATEYTEPAQKYANASSANSLQKEIVPIELRPSTLEDEKGRISQINISLNFISLDFDNAKYDILFADNERDKFRNYLRESEQNKNVLQLDAFYNSNGEIIETVKNISEKLSSKFPIDDESEVDGVFYLLSYIKFNERLFAINGIKYHIPVMRIKHFFTIESNGNAKIFIKSEKLGVNKLITDTDMKNAINKVLKKS